ncbi:Hypothetical protein NTJ_08737 [Nesidiocoris tenuis]|uniref:Secreted protein n=1 Tax=Nesidiocoris tenuis TaxID=355587 RepID=A0ABN7AV99_9HEMI|nr:Hypothetical protein NTJ_08737 [Nesidiocoris tenuis]
MTLRPSLSFPTLFTITSSSSLAFRIRMIESLSLLFCLLSVTRSHCFSSGRLRGVSLSRAIFLPVSQYWIQVAISRMCERTLCFALYERFDLISEFCKVTLASKSTWDLTAVNTGTTQEGVDRWILGNPKLLIS